MPRHLGLGLLLGAALGNAAWAQGSTKFDGQYTGELTLAKTVSGDCTEPPLGALYPLTISRGEVRFEYRPRFGTALRGKIDPNGNFTASTRIPKGFVRMTGHIEGNYVSASIESPSCNY